MGKVTVILSDEIERQLRVAIAAQGGRKGDLSRYIEEAVKLWLKDAAEKLK